MPKRIIVIGTSGSGKTTLARQIAAKQNIPHIELDSLNWDANWTMPPDEELQRRVQDAMQTAGESWIMDGNYSRVRDLTWSQADTIIWLDYPLWLIYWRVITRTMKRVFLKQELWNGNRESFKNSFLSKDSVIWWAHTTYRKRKKLYSEMMQSDQYPHLTFLQFTSPKQTDDWLKSMFKSYQTSS